MSYEYVLNRPDHFTCPECGGALAKIEGDPITKYACHIGHVLTGEAMLEAQSEQIETSLGNALALLNERRELCRELMQDGLHDRTQMEQLLRAASRDAESLRQFLNGHAGPPDAHDGGRAAFEANPE